MFNSSLSHTTWNCIYHVVIVPKYRRKILYGTLKAEIVEDIKKLCSYKKVEIVEGKACADHIHLCLRIPPSQSISDFMGYMKGKCTLMTFDRHPEMRDKYGSHLWTRGYFVSTVGLDEEKIKKYIRDQENNDRQSDR